MKLIKTILLAGIIAVSTFNTVHAQDSWVWQYPLPQGNALNDIHFVDCQIATAVGEFGTIIRTTDGGLSWVKQESGVLEHLNRVVFLDALFGFVVGNAGTILHTTDGGWNWNKQTSGTTKALLGVSFSDIYNGTAVGNGSTIVHTSNGGLTWEIQPPPTSYRQYTDVFFTDSNNGTITGIHRDFGDGGREISGCILHTTDGGATWTVQQYTSGGMHEVCFADYNIGLIVGSEPNILRTTDGGTTWTASSIGTTLQLHDVALFDALNGILVTGARYEVRGAKARVFSTTDGGLTWTNQQSDSTMIFRRVVFCSPTNGIGVGYGGILYRTTDIGKTWHECTTGTREVFNDIRFIDQYRGITICGSTIVRTTNGGADWIEAVSDSSAPLRRIAYSDANNWTIVGNSGTILHSTNGGSNWTSQASGTVNDLYAVTFADAETGIAVGSNGTILRTTNRGANWSAISSGTTVLLKSVSFADAEFGLAVGYSNTKPDTILRTTDGGQTWIAQENDLPVFVYDIHLFDRLNGVAIAAYGIFLRTTDGGMSWARTSSNIAYQSKLSFINRDTGVVIGESQLSRTTDGGKSWVEIFPLNVQLRGVHLIDNTTCTVVGWIRDKDLGFRGAILRSTNDVTVGTETPPSFPSHIHLVQNYPNPFSASTTIPIALEKPEFVSLRVYNMLGEEVAVLKEERMEAGDHTATWNPAGIPAGMYFYTLRAGAASVTKRMIHLNK